MSLTRIDWREFAVNGTADGKRLEDLKAVARGLGRKMARKCEAAILDQVKGDAMPLIPDCPKCGSCRRVYAAGERNWYCIACKIGFDDDPDEGGDWSTDPTRRIERQEAFAASREAVKARLNHGRRRPEYSRHRRKNRR